MTRDIQQTREVPCTPFAFNQEAAKLQANESHFATYTLSTPLEAVRHLLSDKPLFRPARRIDTRKVEIPISKEKLVLWAESYRPSESWLNSNEEDLFS